MPSYFGSEGDEPRPSDDAQRSLQKINNLLLTGGGTVSGGNPVVETSKGGATALSANSSRKKAFLQNNGTNVMFVKEGPGCSASDFSASLPGGMGNDDGLGGTYNVLTTAEISVFGTGLRYSVTEVA